GDWEGIILGWLDLAPVDGDCRHAIQPPRRPLARRAVVGEMLREGHDQPPRAIPLLAGKAAGPRLSTQASNKRSGIKRIEERDRAAKRAKRGQLVLGERA